MELKPWDTVHVELIGLYSKSITKENPGSAIIEKNASLTHMTMINPVTGWFEMIEVTRYDLNYFTGRNDE